MKFKLLFVLSLSLLIIQLSAQPPPPPPECSNYAGVDFFPFYGPEICGDYGAFVELNIITNGPPMGEFYDIIVTGTDGSQGFGFGDDYGFGFADLMPNSVEGCEAVEVSFEMIIICPYTGEELDVVDLGTYTVYPQLMVEVVEPGCAEGENGSATLVAFDGTICDGPIEGVAGTDGDCETQQPGTLSYDFNPFPDALYCFFNFNDELEVPCTELEFGCTDATACNFSETAVCDDGSCVFAEPCCPRPLADGIPTGICGGYSPDNSFCLTFDGDITAIDIYGMFITSASGGFGFPISSDPATNEVCFTLDIFYNYDDICQPFDDVLTLEYNCFETGEFVTENLGTITIYPAPFFFDVFTTPSPECGVPPTIEPSICGTVITGEIIEPINDCENLTPGILNYTIDPGFDITNAPDCLSDIFAGEVPIAPCEEDCPCDGVFCSGTCTDLMVTAAGLPQTVCTYGGDPISIEVTGQGASTATYFGDIIFNGNQVDGFFHQLGDPTTFDIFPFFYGPGVNCEPVTYTLEYEIFCAYEYVLLASGTLGDITVYPEPFLFFPEIMEGQPCGAGTTILPAPCGTVVTDPEPIPNPQCGEGSEDQIVTWTVDVGFDIADAPDCFDASFVMGEFTVFGCPDNPGDPCFTECLGEGTLDENCTCVVEELPQIVITDAPVAACQGEPIMINVDFTGAIPPGQFYELQVTNQNGFLVSSIFIDEYTAFPLTVDLFDYYYYYYDFCTVSEETYTFTLRCFYDFSIIGTPVTVGPVTIYPNPFNFTPFIQPGIPCESEPVININGYCGETLDIIENVPPVDDCDAPVAGFISYLIVPPFDITNAPACFTDPLSGQAPIPPCLIDCPCDGTFCQNVCLDLMATATDFPTEVCPYNGVPYQLDITGIGADFGTYFILTFDNNGFNIGFDVHNPGDPTTIFPLISPFTSGCEPEDQTFTYEIQCPDDGSILASGTLGTLLVYPDPFNFFPNITPSIPCVQDLMITPAPCGTIVLDPDPIPVPGCGGEDTEVSWSVDFGFDYPPDCYAFPIEGTEPVFACAGNPGDPCDDNNPCTVNDVLDENCSCIGEGPTATFDSTLPEAACSNQPVDFTVTVDMIPDPDGLLIILTDATGNFFGFNQIFPGDPLTNTFAFFPFTNSICAPTLFDLFLELRCPYNFEIIGTSIPVGSITIYPPIDPFIPEIEPAIVCGEAPVINPPGCGELTTTLTPADPIACPAGSDGLVEWIVDFGFDASDAPDCFDTTEISGQEPIPACSNCCPVATEVSVADSGPFCTGDITEVCVTFDAPFESDAQVNINGVDAVAGESQLCFDLPLVNDGCSFEPVQVPFEIECTIDGTASNGITPEILVAPDPANFQYMVFPGGCGFPPFVGPPNNQPPCFVFSNTSVVVTDPVDGCPPTDGETEVFLDYLDNNFNPLDISAFACDGFPASIILPQPGCSTCPCPNPVVNVTLTENTCEGGVLEICIEFEEGDEANAIGTQININGDFGTFANLTVSGDGMNTIYCSEFNSSAIIDCVPIEENFTIDLFCSIDGTPLFNGTAVTTIYPSLDKFSYEVIPAVDNCPLPADYPEIISTGDCDLDIFDVITVDPEDGCPPVPGSITYSVNYLDGTLFTNAPAECLFTELTALEEPIPACDTCQPNCSIIPEMATNIVCNDNGTPEDASDDTYTFDIVVNGNNTDPAATNTFNDDQGNTGIAYGTTVSYGPYPIAGGNVTVNFTDADDAGCAGMMMAAAPATCSEEVPCEDEISGTVIPPMGCAVSGITVTIYDDMGTVVTTLVTNANGVYDSTPTTYPCGDYTAELTAGLPTCYTDANGETGPKPFTIDDDPNNDDTDGTDFEGMPVSCEDEISGTVIPPTGCAIAGITVTIYDDTGAVVTTLTTDANGVYDSSPTAYPCGDYTAELTANLPTCYTDANGETGPKPFTIDDDLTNDDTDGTDFMADDTEPVTCSISAEVSEIVCDNNDTPQDGSDDVVTITVTVSSTGPWTAGDGMMGNDGDTYTFPATAANNTVTMMFSVDEETDCETVFTMIANDCDVPAIPTLSQWGLIVLCLLMMSLGAIKITSSTLNYNLKLSR